MPAIPTESGTQDRSTREAADLEIVRRAAKAGLADASEAVTRREHRRVERERMAYKSHYLGMPPR